jgi:hypothetical protein
MFQNYPYGPVEMKQRMLLREGLVESMGCLSDTREGGIVATWGGTMYMGVHAVKMGNGRRDKPIVVKAVFPGRIGGMEVRIKPDSSSNKPEITILRHREAYANMNPKDRGSVYHPYLEGYF